MSRGVKSAEEVENCLWGLSSSVHRLLTRRCRCSKSISLSSCRGGEAGWRGMVAMVMMVGDGGQREGGIGEEVGEREREREGEGNEV